MIECAKYNIISKVVAYCLLFLSVSTISCKGQEPERIIMGAEQISTYSPLIKHKNIALVVNHTSLLNQTHLVDTLLRSGFHIKKVFAPEHGFRGEADAGATILSGTDKKSGLPIISLYGKNKKPSSEQLKDIEVVIFDIQDVGTRFYTYISTMHLVMEACAENNIKVIVLDRPNPNGSYIDGPILEVAHQSFVGMHPIPILHGLTVGELAQMVNGEKWLANGIRCDLTVIPMKHYSHDLFYSLPIKPSPNLPNDLSIALYPSLCLFEGTVISVGRGTEGPFQQIGHPALEPHYSDYFTPKSMAGAKYPPLENQPCYGIKFNQDNSYGGLDLSYLINFHQQFPDSLAYFNSFFTKLVGTEALEKQIKAGFSEEEIRLSWQNGLESYKLSRKKYLLYP